MNVVDETKNKTQKKTKDQIKREKMLNSSMVFLSKKNQELLGILSVQPEKNIFYLSSKMFVKVYILKGVELTDNRKKILISTLCENSGYRMRLSSFTYKNGKAPIISLTVFVPGTSYAVVADEMDDFDRMLETLMENKFKIRFSTCDIGDVFMFVYMNFNGMMKKITSKSVVKKSTNIKKNFFQDIKEMEGGYFINKNGKFGCSYLCTQIMEELDSPFDKLKQLGCTYLSCIDFQVIEENDVNYFNKSLEESYNSVIKDDLDTMINLTFMIDMIYDSEIEKNTCDPLARQILFDCGLIMAPGVGVQEKVVDSIASFGIIDFHCSRNADLEMLSKLVG